MEPRIREVEKELRERGYKLPEIVYIDQKSMFEEELDEEQQQKQKEKES